MLERVPRMTPCKREYLHDRSTEGGLEAIISVVFKATFCQARARGFIPHLVFRLNRIKLFSLLTCKDLELWESSLWD